MTRFNFFDTLIHVEIVSSLIMAAYSYINYPESMYTCSRWNEILFYASAMSVGYWIHIEDEVNDSDVISNMFDGGVFILIGCCLMLTGFFIFLPGDEYMYTNECYDEFYIIALMLSPAYLSRFIRNDLERIVCRCLNATE